MTIRRFRLTTVLLTIGAALLLTFLWVVVFGRIHGEEFSPDTFSRRYYRYFRLPIVHLQVWPIHRFTSVRPLEKHLVANGYIKTMAPPKKWHLVKSYWSGSPQHDGDAEVLCRYLDVFDEDGDLYWLQWTNDHAKLAKILWPEVADLAREELYIFIPDIFSLAAAANDAARFRSNMNQILARKYETVANLQEKLKNYSVAEHCYAKALTFEPDRPASQRGQSRCRRALGHDHEHSTSSDPSPT